MQNTPVYRFGLSYAFHTCFRYPPPKHPNNLVIIILVKFIQDLNILRYKHMLCMGCTHYRLCYAYCQDERVWFFTIITPLRIWVLTNNSPLRIVQFVPLNSIHVKAFVPLKDMVLQIFVPIKVIFFHNFCAIQVMVFCH